MNIIILGAGSTAISVTEIILSSKIFNIMGYVGTEIENKELDNKIIYKNIPFLGGKKSLNNIPTKNTPGFVSAVGNRYLRELAFYEAIKCDFIPVNIISNKSSIENSSSIDSGIIIFPHTHISFNVNISENTLIETNVVIENNVSIGSNCNIESSSIISGNVVIKKNVVIGKNSVIAPNVMIGKNQFIKPNSYIENNLPDKEREEIHE
jgi:NDP-sugar pyrophosphorylase family protein